MNILRSEAVIWCSFIKMSVLSEEETEKYISNALSELDEDVNSEAEKVKYAREYIEHRFSLYTNTYLGYIVKQNTGIEVNVEGIAPQLFACKCCGFKTLTLESNYDICKVCFWEDDGLTNENRHSGPNHMTLGEAKSNFLQYGACEESSLQFLDKDRFLQFNK